MLLADDKAPKAHVALDQPLDTLIACHDKIRQFCNKLDELPAYIDIHGLTNETKQHIHQIITYFDTVGPAHHADEEEEVFPIILTRLPSSGPLIEQLIAEHGYLHSCWNAIRDDLLLAVATETDILNQISITEFVRLYRQHAEHEEEWLIPIANALLSYSEKQQAADRMAARRQQPLLV